MQLSEYQSKAQLTDRCPGDSGDALVIPLMGLAGEIGSLQAEYKKFLRDGDAHHMFRDGVAEELGDILWYLANIATKFSLSLDDIALGNLNKTRARWKTTGVPAFVFPFDDSFPESEQLPRKFTAIIRPQSDAEGAPAILTIDGQQVGDPLRDNTYAADGYRFHDVFHLGQVAILGWSPTVRSLLKRKRKSAPIVDEVEDGGRAVVVDEAVTAIVWNYARNNQFLDGVDAVDYSVLETVKSITSHLEVRARSSAEWELTILQSYAVWRQVKAHNGGVINVDMVSRRFEFLGPVAS